MSRSEVDVTGGGIDVSVTEERLHHREIDTGLGEDCSEMCDAARAGARRPPRSGPGDSGTPSEPRRRQRAAPMWAPPRPGTGSRSPLGPLGEEVDIDHRRDIRIQRDTMLLRALPCDSDPAAADIDVLHVEAEDFHRPQPAPQHQPGDRPIPRGPQTPHQRRRCVLRRQRDRQPSRLPQPQRGPCCGASDRVSEHPRPLPAGPPTRFPAPRDRVASGRVPQSRST